MYAEGAEIESTSSVRQAAESDPLLGGDNGKEKRKPFYRPRPLCDSSRGMTLAPRIEVLTQLSCNRLHGQDPHNHTLASSSFTTIPITTTLSQDAITPFYYSIDPLGPTLHPHDVRLAAASFNYTTVSGLNTTNGNGKGEDDPRDLPSNRCLSDPVVQADAARLQTMMTTTMGLLSALTTGWWGHFGERHGRTKVLAIVTFGVFLTDLTFILVSTPSSPFAAHGHRLLVLAPIIEGVLGGWSTLQSATLAYLSDCTSSGSRAQIFSRFTGVFYIGISVGPSIGGYFIKHPLFASTTNGRLSVTCVFWIAIVCSFVNFLLVLFVFPESLNKAKRLRAIAEQGKGKARAHDDEVIENYPAIEQNRKEGVVRAFLKPLSLFLPAVVYDGGKRRRDWSLTFLGGALLLTMISTGIYQIKYLYAVHVYGWGVERLSYYISFMGSSRAIFLLVICPWIIAAFKPKPQAAHTSAKTSKPKPTKAHLAREIAFDLRMTRCSLLIDILSNIFITLGPVPAIHSHGGSVTRSQVTFVLASGLSSWGSGAPPALQSLGLCIMQTRTLETSALGGIKSSSEGGVGQLFGALAVMQALGQMIIGPMFFGIVYSGTVAMFPKAIFVTAGGMLMCALVLVFLVRGPVVHEKRKKRMTEERERGRSRIRKDLRGGALAGYGAGHDCTPLQQPSSSSPSPSSTSPSAMSPDPENAVAGPSTLRSSPSPSPTSHLFLPPPPLPRTQPTYLHSTQDLLGRFHLLSAYDKYVRPFALPTETSQDQPGIVPVTPGANGGLDKGKGKETEGGPVTPVVHEGDGGDDEGGKGDKKQKNNYKHLIKGIPGKHSMKKDDYLTTMMLVPPKQRIQIAPFDSRTQREAFTVSLEGLKGWNPNALVLESAQVREDRKKRKEARRLQKLQAQAALAAPVAQPQPIPASASATSTTFNRPPQNPNPTSNGTSRPGSTASLARPTPVTTVPPTQPPGSTIPRSGSAVSKPAVPRPGSTVPRPGSTKPLPPVQTAIPRVSTPLRSATTATPTSAQPYQATFDAQRGVKRERDDAPVVPLTNGLGVAHVNGLGNGNGVAVSAPKAVINAKAGSAGIRPRPIKKQRMDMQGQARDVTVTQQPTPQGV
ncbi:hypothetical protein C0995_000116 [Termitomyces sp. Mi166|nr:hypothetical protein C0995_000116 [Termitomyces sp. Mi166\